MPVGRRFVFKVAFCIGIAILLLLSAVPFEIAPRTGAKSLTTLTWGMIESIDSLNPFIGVNDNAYIFYGLVYDYLIAVDQDLKPKPNLAKSWFKVPDAVPYGSVWQYNLSTNTTWHDGEPFDADDVVFTLNMQIGSNYDSIWAYQPYTVLIQSIEKVDQYAVRIHFKDLYGNPSPCPFGDALMMPIVPEHIWGLMTPSVAAFQFENYDPVGTGPFKCTKHTKDEYLGGDAIVLDRNPDYHGMADYGEEVHFDRLVLKFYLEPAGMLSDIQRGKIDMAMFNAPNFMNLQDWLARNPGTPIQTYHGLVCTGFSIDLEVNMKEDAGNGTNSLRLDPEVRKAMAYATDKEYIRDNIYKGYAQIGSTIIHPIYSDIYWEPGPDEIYAFNLTKANETLTAAGYAWDTSYTKRLANSTNPYSPGGELKFTIVVEAELSEDRDTAFFLQEEWAKIGIDIHPLMVSTGVWNTMIYGYAYDLTISYWSGDPDPSYLLFIETSFAHGGWSENKYSRPAYDENYTKAVETIDPVERRGYMINCQKMMYEDCAFMVTVYPHGCYAWRNDTFSGWGDWQNHSGRTLSNFWTANPLYFDLVPLKTEEGGMSLMYVGLGVVVVVVVAVAVVLLRKRRPKKEEEVRLP